MSTLVMRASASGAAKAAASAATNSVFLIGFPLEIARNSRTAPAARAALVSILEHLLLTSRSVYSALRKQLMRVRHQFRSTSNGSTCGIAYIHARRSSRAQVTHGKRGFV